MSRVIKPYEARNTTVSNGIRLRFLFGAAIGITAVLPNKVVKGHPVLPATAGTMEDAACPPLVGGDGKH